MMSSPQRGTRTVATIIGTNGNDWIVGTNADDFIRGQAGDDVLRGGGGNDYLMAGSGTDVLWGGQGDDWLVPSQGSALLAGGAGIDTLDLALAGENGAHVSLADRIAYWTGGSASLSSIENIRGSHGDDTLFLGGAGGHIVGRGGNDVIGGSDRDDRLDGGEGDDGIDGAGGEDLITGGNGFDELYGGGGNDFLYGGNDDDFLLGGEGDDGLRGGEGADYLDGDLGNDRIYGGNGDDWLQSGAGDDLLFGGNGSDVYAGDAFFLDPSLDGHALALSFRRGVDFVNIDNFLFVGGAEQFAFLDTNGNGKLDADDDHIDVTSVTYKDSERASLIIDLGTFANDFEGGGTLEAGQYTLAFFGVRVLDESDFLP